MAMQDYTKKRAAQSAQQNNALPIQGKTNGIPNSALQDVFAGRRRADSSMMGHSQNLAPSIAAKMSRAFGMDLTGMQVYRSDAMKGTGMRGMAQGNKIVLSSDVNLNTLEGQAVFGHEVSHIRAQSQGIGTGHSGLYENAALEHQADTEGMLAAQGRSIYSDGMDTGIGMQYGLGMQGVEGLTPLGSGMSANAGAPMQASASKPGGLFGLFYTAKPKDKKEVYNLANQKADSLGTEITKAMKGKNLSEKQYYKMVKSKYDKLRDYITDMKLPPDVEEEIEQNKKTSLQQGEPMPDWMHRFDWTTEVFMKAAGRRSSGKEDKSFGDHMFESFQYLNTLENEKIKKQQDKENAHFYETNKHVHQQEEDDYGAKKDPNKRQYSGFVNVKEMFENFKKEGMNLLGKDDD